MILHRVLRPWTTWSYRRAPVEFQDQVWARFVEHPNRQHSLWVFPRQPILNACFVIMGVSWLFRLNLGLWIFLACCVGGLAAKTMVLMYRSHAQYNALAMQEMLSLTAHERMDIEACRRAL